MGELRDASTGWLTVEELRALPAAVGPDGEVVSARRLESLRYRRLMPALVTTGHIGRATIRRTPPGSDLQLARVLLLAATLKDDDALRVRLWYDGFDVPLSEVGGSLQGYLQRLRKGLDEEVRKASERAGGGDGLTALAHDVARMRSTSPIPRATRMRADEREAATLAVFQVIGYGQVNDAAGKGQMVEKLIGMGDGRRQRVAGQEPWIAGPPDAFVGAASELSLPALAEAVSGVDDDALVAARSMARKLLSLPWVVTVMDAVTGGKTGGLAALAALGEDHGVAVLLVAVCIALARGPLAENAAALAAAAQDVQRDLARGVAAIEQMTDSEFNRGLDKVAPARQDAVRRLRESPPPAKFRNP